MRPLVRKPIAVLWHVSLRRVAPAIAVAALWIATIVVTEISVTDFFQIRTFAEEVYTQAALGSFGYVFGNTPVGPADPLPAIGFWSGLLLSAAFAVLVIGGFIKLFADRTEASNRPPWIWRLRGGRWPAATLLAACLVLLVGVPLANLAYKAGILVTTTDAGRVRSWSVERLFTASGGRARRISRRAVAFDLARHGGRDRRVGLCSIVGLELAGLCTFPAAATFFGSAARCWHTVVAIVCNRDLLNDSRSVTWAGSHSFTEPTTGLPPGGAGRSVRQQLCSLACANRTDAADRNADPVAGASQRSASNARYGCDGRHRVVGPIISDRGSAALAGHCGCLVDCVRRRDRRIGRHDPGHAAAARGHRAFDSSISAPALRCGRPRRRDLPRNGICSSNDHGNSSRPRATKNVATDYSALQ